MARRYLSRSPHRSRGAKASPPARSTEAKHGPTDSVAQLQQTIGNRAVGRVIRAKLKIGAPGDQYEQEADRMAEQVVNMPAPTAGEGSSVSPAKSGTSIQRIPTTEDEKRVLQVPHELAKGPHEEEEGVVRRTHMKEEDDDKLRRQPVKDEEENKKLRRQPLKEDEEERKTVQAKAGEGGLHVSNQTQAQIDNLKGGGRPLPKDARNFFESHLGEDLSHVRVHTDASAAETAASINARAFTVGHDIAFGSGEYTPETSEGKRLLAHELTHVVQQENDRPSNYFPHIQRKIIFEGTGGAGETTLDNNMVEHAKNQLTGIYLSDIIEDTDDNFLFTKAYRRNLIRQIVDDMHRSRDNLYYSNLPELANEVRKRALTSLYVRSSQGSTRYLTAFGYPFRGAARNCGPRVNKAAQAYWGPVQGDVHGLYGFELSDPIGKQNAYQAVVKLFAEQSRACDRTLIHCDNLTSVIHFRTFAETLGEARFNDQVRNGQIRVWLHHSGFEEITERTGTSSPDFERKSLTYATVASEDDFIIGDHVILFNHESYDSLNAIPQDPWRLENAIVIDRRGGERRFQGHGYFSPINKNYFINAMMRWYNRKVDEAQGYIRSRNWTQLSLRYPHINFENGQWIIRYQKLGGFCDDKNWYGFPLRRLQRSDFANPFANPCDGRIWVIRPLESR